jgi:hypothetical protein
MEAGQYLHPRPDIVATLVSDGEVIVSDPTTQREFSLNIIQTHLWRLLAAGMARSEMCLMAREAWDLSDDDANDLVDTFLNQLREQGIVE